MGLYQNKWKLSSQFKYFSSLEEEEKEEGSTQEIYLVLNQFPRNQYPFLTAITMNWCTLLSLVGYNTTFTIILVI